jgi:Na+-translocating ferredoxin:NAD+ oxidoreductase RnfG subunit
MRNLLKSFAPPSKRFFIAISVAVLFVIAIVVLIIITANPQKRYTSLHDFMSNIMAYQELNQTVDGIDNVRICLDKDGQAIGYRIESYAEEGFRDRITVCSYISSDGTLMYGMTVVNHSETKNQGSQITESAFRQQFELVQLPLWFNDGSFSEDELPQNAGTRIDAVSGATISCNGAFKAVQVGYTYVQEQLVK